MKQFGTVVNCMDGRVQIPVLTYLQARFGVDWIDSITEPGPIKILAENTDKFLVQSILDRLTISVKKHGSVGVAIVGHYDCTGNTVPRETQVEQLHQSQQFLRRYYPELPILLLWVDEHWQVSEI